jgi:hypothetical protein
MLLKTEFLLIALGIFLLISRKKNNYLFLLGLLVLLSIIPSSLTRDGATHSSRSFLFILPLILSATLGLYSILNRRFVSLIIMTVMVFESFLYAHDYFLHYPLISEREFHAGLKDLVSQVNKYPGQTIVVTRTYEPSLIFFLYYANFPPAVAQDLIRQGKITTDIKEDLNLEGVRVTGSNVFLASIKDVAIQDPLPLKDAIYVLPVREAASLIEKHKAIKISDIYLPSGELFFTVIKPVPLSIK